MSLGSSLFSLSRSMWLGLASGLIVTLSLFIWVYHLEQSHEQAQFERRAAFQMTAVQQGMANAINALENVNLLFKTNGDVSRKQFHTFTRALRARHPQIEAFAYHRRISQAERSPFEAHMRKHSPGFNITSLMHGKRVIAEEKEHYNVIDYVEPSAHATVQGLDASSLSFQDEAMRRAAGTGLPTATDLLRFDHMKSMFQGIRISMAVYQDGVALQDVSARHRGAVGYTVMVLRTDGLIAKILASAGIPDNSDVAMRVYASALPDESTLIYGAKSTTTEWSRPVWPPGDRLQPVSQSFDVAGKTWHIVTEGEAVPFMTSHDGALFVLFAGIFATLVTVVYMRSVAMREQHIRQVVDQRTEQLKEVNHLLVEDIAARKRLVQALASSEERARELAELASDWSWEQDEHFRFTNFSQGAWEKGSQLPPARLGTTRWESHVDPDAADWVTHRATLEAHLPFKNFEYKRQINGTQIQWLSSSGKPQFDADGKFKGYLGTSRDITDRKLAEEALRRSQSELRELTTHQERIKEAERKRIAREIHDELGQNLLAIRLDVSNMASRSDYASISKDEFDMALAQIDTTIKGVRAVINDLRPSVLDLGLHAAVQWQAKEFQRRSGVACEVHVDHEEFALDDQRSTALFRCVQESLTNVSRHAQANHVWISIQRKDGWLVLKIADNGVGVSPSRRKDAKTFGLIGIEERMQALGGRFSVTSEPRRGTTLELSIPI